MRYGTGGSLVKRIHAHRVEPPRDLQAWSREMRRQIKAAPDVPTLSVLHDGHRDLLSALEDEHPGRGERLVERFNKKLRQLHAQAFEDQKVAQARPLPNWHEPQCPAAALRNAADVPD
jgi:hypothetical protein